MRYFRVRTREGFRIIVEREGTKFDLTTVNETITSFFDIVAAAEITGTAAFAATKELLVEAPEVSFSDYDGPLAPIMPAEIWAAGVTYQISEEARKAESGMPDVYIDVYENERPELFLKSTPSRTVGPGDAVGIRADSDWDAPEPELGVVLYRGSIVGYTIGNDVSSRSIEGANPLYLPQAKVYRQSCAIGPCVVPAGVIADPHDLDISMRVSRDGKRVFAESTSTAEMVRTCEELVEFVTAHNSLPSKAVLLTGASLVPDESFTLTEGDTVEIEIEEIGVLKNSVITV